MKLQLKKIVEVLSKIKDDDFYFKNYAPEIIESYADEFAIGFAEWIIDIDNKPKGEFTIKELLEIYKKENERN